MGIIQWCRFRASGAVLALGMVATAGAAPPPSAATDAVVRFEDVRFQRYGVEDGLSQTSGTALLQDDEGYVWVGTQDGLNRFDAYEFKTYRTDAMRPETLPDNWIRSLERSRRGGFWVVTEAGNLARYLPSQDHFVRYPDPSRDPAVSADGIHAIRETPDGRLWVASASGGLRWLDPGSDTFRSLPPAHARTVGPIAAIEPFGPGVLVVGPSGLWTLAADGRAPRRWTAPREELASGQNLAVSPEGADVWLGTELAGIFHFNRNGVLQRHWQKPDGLPHLTVRDLQFDRKGQLWAGTQEGLARFDRQGRQLRVWTYGSGLSGNNLASSRIQSLMVDRDGLLWVGTWLNGISVFAPGSQAFGELQVEAAANRTGVGLAVAGPMVDPDGSLWFRAAEGVGLLHYDFDKGVLRQYRHDPQDPASLPGNLVLDVLRDRTGQLWVATSAGLARKTTGGFITYRADPKTPGSLPGGHVSRLLEARDGTLWVGTLGGGLAALCPGCSTFRVYRARPAGGMPGIGDDSIDSLLEDRSGAIWIGLRQGGLTRLDPRTNRVDHFGVQAGVPGTLANDSISWVSQDSKGRLWVGNSGGVDWADLRQPGRPYFRNYNMRSGLAANAIGGIVEDRRGRMWISTTVGISRLDPGSGEIVNYGPRDGTQLMGYFVGSAARLRDGRIAFGGMRGITIVDPEAVEQTPSPHRVALTDVRLLRLDPAAHGDGGPTWMQALKRGDRLVLPPEGDDISLEFSALSFANPEGLRYAYRMDGVNDGWIEVDSRRRIASYNNLPPGNYLFRARARSPNGEFWGPELALPIRLTPPWWLTTWAKLGYLLIALAVLGAVAWTIRQRLAERSRSRRAIEESEQRLKLALWGTGDELWDLDLVHGRVRRQNPMDPMDPAAGAADSPPAMANDDVVLDARAMRDSVHPDDLERFDRAMDEHLAGQHEYMEVSYRVLDRDGHWRWLLSRGRVVARDASGKALRVAGTNSDITRIKEGELALERINAELESRVRVRTEALNETNDSLRNTIDELRQAQQQLVDAEKMAALGGLVAGVAHEINTPLGVGVTAASFLDQEARRLGQRIDDGSLDRAGLDQFRQAASESAQLILRNLMRADRMVKSFKQVAVDQSSEESRRIELRSYLEDVMLSLQPTLRQRQHTVTIDGPTVTELETYPGAIYQIVSNLVMNSVVHAFPGRDGGRIHIQLESDERSVSLVYQDDGVGMAEDVRKRIFEPFFTTRRGTGGSGLGLHIAWNLATQALGGTITCDSAPGAGTRFVLRIPRTVPRRATTAA